MYKITPGCCPSEFSSTVLMETGWEMKCERVHFWNIPACETSACDIATKRPTVMDDALIQELLHDLDGRLTVRGFLVIY